MAHGPAVKLAKDNASSYKTRIGLWMFLVYTLTYAGFMAINTLDPSLMEKTVFGQTVAVAYGLGLIIFALVLAVIYNHFCSAAEKRLNP